jgi:hypothetical protein
MEQAVLVGRAGFNSWKTWDVRYNIANEIAGTDSRGGRIWFFDLRYRHEEFCANRLTSVVSTAQFDNTDEHRDAA